MASESFFKDIFRSFCRTFLRVIAIGIGIFVLILAFTAIFSSSELPQTTTVRVLPNDEWKMSLFSSTRPTILKIPVTGVIGLNHMTKDDVSTQLIETLGIALNKDQVKAIILTVNTPGGLADQSDAIYRLLLEYKKRYKVPVYAYIEGMCASGGMYVACAADKIFASPDSLVGHVGVIFSPPFFNFSKLMTRLGIDSKTLFAGKEKDSMNPFRPWKEGEGEAFQFIIDSMYERFVSIVSTHRPRLTPEILQNQGARLWPTKEALEYGYIDGEVNALDDVLRLVAQETGIQNNYQFIELETRHFLEALFGPRASLDILSGKVEHKLQLAGELPEELFSKPLYLFHPAL
jgi:protease-4